MYNHKYLEFKWIQILIYLVHIGHTNLIHYQHSKLHPFLFISNRFVILIEEVSNPVCYILAWFPTMQRPKRCHLQGSKIILSVLANLYINLPKIFLTFDSYIIRTWNYYHWKCIHKYLGTNIRELKFRHRTPTLKES